MILILLVTQDRASFSDLAAVLKENNVEVMWVESGKEALSIVTDKFVHLLLADEQLSDMTALELIKEVVSINPMINCAAVSSLSPEDFHEAYEGLGVLMQIPPSPGAKDGEKLLAHLKKIYSMDS